MGIYLNNGINEEVKVVAVSGTDPSLFRLVMKQEAINLDECVKFNFFAIKTIKIIHKKFKIRNHLSGNYYFGDVIPYKQMRKKDKTGNVIEDFCNDDEYLVCGVIHPLSGTISKVYPNDEILDQNLIKHEVKEKVKVR
ncbi:MAG: hypothetical protein PHY26_04830 [Bacilli bacterium]|jgi:hypothetical protein|nr:hypothetical protein [Bacilli bacterium]